MLLKIREKLKCKKGDVSIVYVIFSAIIIIVITAFLTINKSSYIFNEIQSVMDTSATTSLTFSIDKEKAKEEILSIGSSYISSDGTKQNVDKDELNKIIKNNYIDELKRNISSGNIDGVLDYELINFKAEMVYDDWGVNVKDKNGNYEHKKRPQVIMNSIVRVKLKSYAEFDSLSDYTINFYYARKPSNDIQIEVEGKTEDGEIILLVRTAARVVYR